VAVPVPQGLARCGPGVAQDVVRLILKRQPEGPPSIRQALLVSKTALHFAKSGGAVYNDHVRAQPMARLKRLEIGERTLVESTR
jgi:hypothetical protein